MNRQPRPSSLILVSAVFVALPVGLAGGYFLGQSSRSSQATTTRISLSRSSSSSSSLCSEFGGFYITNVSLSQTSLSVSVCNNSGMDLEIYSIRLEANDSSPSIVAYDNGHVVGWGPNTNNRVLCNESQSTTLSATPIPMGSGPVTYLVTLPSCALEITQGASYSIAVTNLYGVTFSIRVNAS